MTEDIANERTLPWEGTQRRSNYNNRDLAVSFIDMADAIKLLKSHRKSLEVGEMLVKISSSKVIMTQGGILVL